jgi:hypothetical protein
MKKIFFLIILAFLNFNYRAFAQFDPNLDFENYSNSSSPKELNLYQYQNNNFKDTSDIQTKTTDNYQPNYQNIYNNQFNNNFVIPNKKTSYNFQDGMGEGYRVYDNSNRQSYFCSLNNNKKNIFTHQNNFNGVYVGAGLNFVNTAMDVSQNLRYSQGTSPGSSKLPTYSASSNSIVPSIIIGQGRLFSNGLYLGQEMSILVGDFSVDKKNLKPQTTGSDPGVELEQIKFRASNLSFYSGKFGFNIFDVILPYIKVGISFSSSNFQFKLKDGSVKNSTGEYPFLTYGGGIDISVAENFRFMIDYTMFKNSSSEISFYQTNEANNVAKTYTLTSDANSSLMRANLVYRF